MGIPLGDLLGCTSLFTHGSTVVDNALLTRGGARTGLITTEGFEDTLLVTRGAYGRWAGLAEEGLKHPVKTDRAPSLVPAERIRGVPERVDYKGAGDPRARRRTNSAEAAIRHLGRGRRGRGDRDLPPLVAVTIPCMNHRSREIAATEWPPGLCNDFEDTRAGARRVRTDFDDRGINPIAGRDRARKLHNRAPGSAVGGGLWGAACWSCQGRMAGCCRRGGLQPRPSA